MRQGWDDLAISGRLITAKGVKPKGLNQCWRDNFYLYGVVEPESGYSFTCEFSHLDADCFQRFLDLLAVELGDDVAVMQMEQGSFHRSLSVDYPENIIPIFQPSHCQATFWGEASPQKLAPELNPIERFWEFLKSNLEWENYPSVAQLRQKLTQLLETITPETIASLTSYDFILEALFSAAL